MSVLRARKLRKKSTWAEKCLWRLLRSRRLAVYKFRRQYHKEPYYLDFYCLEGKFAVELDGSGHGYPEQQKYDLRRDAFFAGLGITVKRVWNHQLARSEDRENLVSNIWRQLQERAPHPENAPLPRYRRSPDQPGSAKPSP